MNDGTYDVDRTKPVLKDQDQPLGNRPAIILTPVHSRVELSYGDYISNSIDHGGHG